jgi:3',5'-cyclic AMP phosphodiesterase CpdA
MVPGIGRFPYVRLRGPVAIVGLSTAIPHLPLVAAGELGKPQRMALHALLAHRQLRGRLPILLQHHPCIDEPTRRDRFLKGLRDADEERGVLSTLARGLVLHGHLHRRLHRRLTTARGVVDVVGTASASAIDDHPQRRAGFNLYEIDRDGSVARLCAFRMAADDPTRFIEMAIPDA